LILFLNSVFYDAKNRYLSIFYLQLVTKLTVLKAIENDNGIEAIGSNCLSNPNMRSDR
jgi:hypothetical protein